MFHLSDTTEPCASGIAISVTAALELKHINIKNEDIKIDLTMKAFGNMTVKLIQRIKQRS